MARSRLQQVFDQQRTALIPYIMAGYPDKKTSLDVLCALPQAGADIIELGMPFSDPVADGATIQSAGLKALENGTTVQDVLAMVYHFRQENSATPILLMGYVNPIYKYGAERFMQDASKAGVDGLLIVDLPVEEEAEFSEPAARNSIELIHLISPVTPDDRIKYVSDHSSGFLYYVSMTGITGTGKANNRDVKNAVKSLQNHTDLPIGIGFGISTAEQAAELKHCADAIIIGSAVIKKMSKDDPKTAVIEFIEGVRAAID